MLRRFLLATIVSTSLAVFGQAVSNGTSLPASAPGPGNTGYVNGTGGNGQMASTVTFASPAPAAGISEAGLAGISDHAPIQQGVQSTLAPSQMVYTSGPSTTFYAGAPSVNPPITSETNTPAPNNLGPSFYSSTASGSTPGTGMNVPLNLLNPSSLGEVAVQFKTRAHNARLYTNADLQQLIGRNGSGNVIVAANRAPSGAPASAQNTQQPIANTAPAQTTGNTSATNSTQSDAQRANPGSATQSEPTAQAGNAGSDQNATSDQAGEVSTAQNAGNNTSGNAGTTPQTRERQSGDDQAMNRLPATSTILPLLGLIGLASSGAGLWYRRSRK